MKRLLNIGSINIDYVYRVPHFLRAGETLEAAHRDIFMGGKGLNQSIAAARSGLAVTHLGVIGRDGQFLSDFMKDSGIDTRFLTIDETNPTGHTVIQVTPDGENAILYFAGTNHAIDQEVILKAFKSLDEGDFVLLQNEVNNVGFALENAKKQNLHTVFNPAPYSPEVLNYPLHLVDALIVNETEAQGILATNSDNEEFLLNELRKRFPQALLFLTLGAKGMVCELPVEGGRRFFFKAFRVNAVDTTGAGDTFVGYAMKAIMAFWTQHDIEKFKALIEEAMLAAAISVTRCGAVPSIPQFEEVVQFKEMKV